MGDMEKALAEVRAAAGAREISDAAARVIASMYHNGGASVSHQFASTGFIADPAASAEDAGDAGTALYRELFPSWMDLSADEQEIASALGTYILDRTRSGRVGRVDGWSGLWL